MKKLFIPIVENVSRKVEICYVVASGLIYIIWASTYPRDALPLLYSLALVGFTIIGFAYANKNYLIGRDIKTQGGFVLLYFEIAIALSVPVQDEAGVLDELLSALPSAISLSERGLSIITSYLVSAIWEEMVFRKYLLGQFYSEMPFPFRKVIICAAIFGATHFDGFPGAFVGGIFLGLLYLRFNSTLLCVFFHLIHNLEYEFLTCEHWICTSSGRGIEQAIGYLRGSTYLALLGLTIFLSIRPKKLLAPSCQ